MISLFSPLFASFPERFGRRNVMVATLMVFSGACLLLAMKSVVWSFALAICLGGAMKVIFDPAMQSYLGDAVPYAQRG